MDIMKCETDAREPGVPTPPRAQKVTKVTLFSWTCSCMHGHVENIRTINGARAEETFGQIKLPLSSTPSAEQRPAGDFFRHPLELDTVQNLLPVLADRAC